MIGHDAKRQVNLRLLLGQGAGNHVAVVLLAGQTLADTHETAQHVGFVVGLNALQNGRGALEAQARVDVLRGKRGQRAVFLPVVLGEHAVPVLQEPVAVASGRAHRTAAAELGALVVVQLGARATRTRGTRAPEVVVFTQAADMALGNAERFPNLDGLVVVFEHGEVQLLDRQLEHLGGELQRPSAHLLLEVLPEAEVAHHLEEAQVAPGRTNDVDVAGTHAFLHRGGADVVGVEFLHMQEIRLELDHAGAREQKRRVVGNERGRRHALAALLLEELQVLLADFRSGHIVHGGKPSLS